MPNDKRVCLTMPTELQARVRMFQGAKNRKAHEWSKIICEFVEEGLKAEGF